MKKRILALITAFITGATMMAVFTGCDGDGGDGGDGKCQFEGCSKKATSAAGEFCDEHSKRLNDYWDAQY